MSDLTSRARSELGDAMFGLPGQRKYPMPDKSHARNALARASEEHNKGKLTDAELAQIRAKANRVLGK